MPDYKASRIVHEFYTFLLPPAYFRATPYEQFNNFSPDPLLDQITFMDSTHYENPYYADVYSGLSGNSYRSRYPFQAGHGQSRGDMRFIHAQTTEHGWEFSWVINANKYKFDSLYPGRGIGMWCAEYVDTGYNKRACISRGQVCRAFIKPGGITSTIYNGEEVVMITAATPDFFLGLAKIPKLPYILRSVANAERALWSGLSRTADALGFAPAGVAGTPFTQDPFAGFANYIDVYLASPNQLLSARPANERHIMGSLSVVHALAELFANHVLVNRGSGWGPIGNFFETFIDTGASLESSLVSLEIGPDSINGACIEAMRHGNWAYWWSSVSKMRFVPDPCNGRGHFAYGTVPYLVQAGHSSLGKLNVTPGPPFPVVNRVAVEGEWSTTFAGGAQALDEAAFAPIHAVYPGGAGVGGGVGIDTEFKGYHGQAVGAMAQSEYARLNQQSFATLTDIPYMGFCFNRFNSMLYVDLKSSVGAYDYTGGLPMRVVGVQIDVEGADGMGGGRPKGQLQLQEVRTDASGLGGDWRRGPIKPQTLTGVVPTIVSTAN